MTSGDDVRKLILDAGGTIEEMGALPDGSGFAMASFPLPKAHWIYGRTGKPPAPWITGTNETAKREAMAELIREVGRYAVRASTMNGKDMDFDPDAMLQNLVVGFLGYWTPDGTSTLGGDE